MAYIGREPVNGFHAKQTLSTDGSTVTFTLDFSVADETSIIVSVGGVLQEPKVAYNLAAGGTQITFTAAPAATDTAYIHYLGQSIVQNLVDLNGVALVLDADADTTIAADTDDQIDIQIAGADDFQFTANKFSVLTGSSQSFADSAKGLFGTGDDLEIYHDGTNSLIANKTGALKIATETSGIAVTIGHTTSETTVADNLTVTGNLTVGGTTSFGDFDITNVGSIALDTITNDGTDITLDSSADIVIDAAGGNIEFKDAGTLQLTLDMDGTAGAQVIQLGVDSDDLIFKQYDGTTVLTLDDDTTVKVATDLTIGDDASLISDAAVLNFGANSEIKLTHVHDTGLLLTDSGGSPTLQLHDANESVSSDGSKLILTSNGVAFSLPTADGSSGQFLKTNGSGVLSFDTVSSAADDLTAGDAAVNLTTSSGNITIDAAANDSDIIFKGTDNSSDITMLTLDGSDAGHATFNNAITSGAVITSGAGLVIADAGNIGSASDTDAIAIASNGQVTLTQTLIGTALDISGDIDVDGTTNLDVVDIDGAVDMASTLQVDGAITSSAGATITTADNSDNLTLTSTDADGSLGPNLRFYRNSSSPADADDLSTVDFEGRNDNSQDVVYAQILTATEDVSDGTEDGVMNFRVMKEGTSREHIRMSGGGGVVINEASLDIDFRVESNDNTHMIFVDAGANHVNIGQAGDSEHMLNVGGNGFFTTADQTDTLTLECTDADANSGPVLCLHRNSGSPANSDLIGRIDFSGESDAGAEQNFAVIKTFADNVSHGSEDGQFTLFTRKGGSEVERMTVGAAATVFNDGSADIDFRIESDSDAHIFFVDAGNNNILFGDGSNASPAESSTAQHGRISSAGTMQLSASGTPCLAVNRVTNEGTVIDLRQAGGARGSISVAGSTATFNTTSDYRLKENVDYDWDATTRLKQLKPARFNFIEDDTNTLLDGFIAHEVSSVVPIAVKGEKDATVTRTKLIYAANGDLLQEGVEEADWTAGKASGKYASDTTYTATKDEPDYQQLDHSKLVPLLVKTVQELEARIKTLEDA